MGEGIVAMLRYGEDHATNEVSFVESAQSPLESAVWAIKLVSMADIGLPKDKLQKHTKDQAPKKRRKKHAR